MTQLDQLAIVLRERFRFPRLTLKTILIGVGTYLLMVLVGGVFALGSRALFATGIIPLPDSIPILLDPRASLSPEALTAFVGGPLVGQWHIVVLFAVHLVLGIVGEELWWRGYVLPRQEVVHGRWTWVVHGLLWWGFHAFKWWDLLAVLPIVLILSFAAQRSQNTWVPTIAHLLANSLLFGFLLIGVLGL